MKAPAVLTQARARLGTFFEEHRLQKHDVPKAILIHELLGLAILLSTWTCAYYFPPSKLPALQGPIRKLDSLIPQSLKTTLASNELASSRLGGAYFEASCVRKVVRPLTIPAKMYLTLKLVLLSNDVCERAAWLGGGDSDRGVEGRATKGSCSGWGWGRSSDKILGGKSRVASDEGGGKGRLVGVDSSCSGGRSRGGGSCVGAMCRLGLGPVPVYDTRLVL